MSDYHIITQDDKRKTVDIVFHIPIPIAGNNEANIKWRDAVVRELGGSGNIVSVLPDISAQEDTELKSGAKLERQKTVRFSSVNLTKLQRKAEIEAAFNAEKTALVAEKQVTLEWIGYEGNVP